MRDRAERAVAALAAGQDGIVTRWQALGAGLSAKAIRCRVESGRWQRVYRQRPEAGRHGDHRGVYATFSGPIGRGARLWAAVLVCGKGAVLSHESAAEAWGLLEGPSGAGDRSRTGPGDRPVHVTVPRGRKVDPPPGIVMHHSSRLPSSRHPARLPPRTRVEETVADLTQSARTMDEAAGVIAEAVRRGLTTHDRIVAAIGARRRFRWRRELLESCGEVADGAHSLLELRYVRRVERPHGLPRATRQLRRKADGRVTYLDNRYERYRTRVELDGQLGHTGDGVLRDVWRDNRAVLEGDAPLRLGWDDVESRACESAAAVAKVLIDGGWGGKLKSCGPCCRAESALRRLLAESPG
ncbi:hypothetical protein HKK72_33805 [Actinomadura sp. HBU206391]|nr:hypothetical protein [Actinomadura sp. HBU206391]